MALANKFHTKQTVWRRLTGGRLCRRVIRCEHKESIMSKMNACLTSHIKSSSLCKASGEGRLNSVYDESYIIKLLQTKFDSSQHKIQKPKSSRSWYDFIVNIDGFQVPCNIKVARGGRSNALCKNAIVYSFSTLDTDKIPTYMSFNKMVQLIAENRKTQRDNKEYYYIYVDKVDNTIIVRSLCDIQHYVSNPQNWLQIDWDKEKKVQLGELETLDMCYGRIRKTLRDSLDKIVNSSNML
jgi:hypothetical protein